MSIRSAEGFIEETKRQYLAGELSQKQVAVVEAEFPEWKQLAA
jgi:hypothetical protein